MDAAKKKQLVDYSKEGCTLEGSPTTVAGSKNDEASLAPHFGGFWRVSWSTVERVLDGDRNFIASDVRFVSWLWAGFGDEVPACFRCYM